MGREALILLFLGAFYFNMSASSAASLNRSSIDESSLVALKTQIISLTLAKNWSQETSFCTWIGVVCSRRHPRVTRLNLPNMGMRGSIAREIGNLSFLTFLDVSNNSIQGLIPSEIGKLRRLRVLDMAFNHLSDQIPHSLGSLTKLEQLDLSNNYLSGDIPTSLSACVLLNGLDLSQNNLTGSIPTGFGNLSRLQHLILWNNQLTGELASTISNISSLVTFDVEYNQISGSIPKHICSQSASKLEILWLHSNKFEGEIPSTSLMHCQSLTEVSLGFNKFRGNLPSEFWNISQIQKVGLSRNEFTGDIPPSIANLSNLMVLDFSENRFHGKIPSEIGKLYNLAYLNLQGNKLSDEVPQPIFNLSMLQDLSLAKNNLSGNLPVSIDKGLPNLQTLVLGANHFHGKIPNSLSNLSLVFVDLSDNSFTQDIPITFGNLYQLRFLSLGLNQLTNNLSMPEQDFLSSLTTCKYLRLLEFSDNPITGVLPKSLRSSNLSASLEVFRARSCLVTSSLPQGMGNLSNLIWLDLGLNDLTGVIPVALGNLNNLQKLWIDGNKLRGSISQALCNLNNLFSVNLSANNLAGQLPTCLGNLSLLREIDLSHNAFNSNIPSTLWSNQRFEKVYMLNNFFDGSLSPEIGNLKSVAELDLSGNQISGEIPSTISQLQSLSYLSLSNNKLEGPIIESFDSLKDLQHLDLSHNNLSGAIPKSLEKLAYLNYCNLSFNDLSGEIPEKGPFANFTAEFFVGNKGLCGPPQFKACKRSNSTPSRKSILLKCILPVIASAALVSLILILVVRRRGGKLLPSSMFDSPFSIAHQRISHLEIIRATNNFDEQSLIGRGGFCSVYRGSFPDETVAAIKIFNLDVQGALKSFDTECEIMRSIRHRNLVKIITSCCNPNFKALVMAYLPNGNLETCLHDARPRLNLLQRFGIMIDVASALEYLHEGYTFPIVHCDLKPTNILLDEEMAAHVADFGIAKLLTQEQRMQLTRTLGTIGYMAPEYGSEGLISTMVDVYSYGILLMEMISRRKPTDEMFSGELTLRRWVCESFPSSVVQIVDDELLATDVQSGRDGCEMWLTSTIELALECTADSPDERPNMKDVLTRIKKFKFNLSNSNSTRRRLK